MGRPPGRGLSLPPGTCVGDARSPSPLSLLGNTCRKTPCRPHHPRGLADSTFVWTMPGLWSLKCSRVAAMSISLAPATHNTHRSGRAQTQDDPRSASLACVWLPSAERPIPAAGLAGTCHVRVRLEKQGARFSRAFIQERGAETCCQMPIQVLKTVIAIRDDDLMICVCVCGGAHLKECFRNGKHISFNFNRVEFFYFE